MKTWTFLSVLASLALALSTNAQFILPKMKGSSPRTLLMPDEDPFYKAPSGWETKPPGTILASRRVPNPLTLNNKDPVRTKGAWQLLYRTQNSIGEPVATVTTVIEPHNAKNNNLFIYHFFSNACYTHCAPSVTVQVGARQDNTYNQMQNAIVVLALQRGWYVSIADDQGPQAAFGSGLQNGYATLDSIRAVKQSSSITGIKADPIITSYGYSGGAFSSGFTLELQPTYAPDVKLAGAAIGGVIPNITALVDLHNKKDRAGFGPPTWIGLSRDFKNFSTWLTENLVPQYEPKFRMAERQCFNANWYTYEYEDLGKYLKRGYNSIKDEIPRSVMDHVGVMGIRGTPQVPMHLYESAGDDSSPVGLADDLYNKWCKAGASISYERNSNTSVTHSAEMVAGFPGALKWLQDRMAGKPTRNGCTRVEHSISTLRSDTMVIEGLVQELEAYLGMPVGPLLGNIGIKLPGLGQRKSRPKGSSQRSDGPGTGAVTATTFIQQPTILVEQQETARPSVPLLSPTTRDSTEEAVYITLSSSVYAQAE